MQNKISLADVYLSLLLFSPFHLRTGPNIRDVAMEMKSSVTPDQVPCGLKIYKGLNGAALTSAFVDFALSNPFALRLYNWLLTTSHPEEHFMSTLGSLTVIKSDKPSEWKVFQRFDEGIMHFKGTMATDISW